MRSNSHEGPVQAYKNKPILSTTALQAIQFGPYAVGVRKGGHAPCIRRRAKRRRAPFDSAPPTPPLRANGGPWCALPVAPGGERSDAVGHNSSHQAASEAMPLATLPDPLRLDTSARGESGSMRPTGDERPTKLWSFHSEEAARSPVDSAARYRPAWPL